MNRSETGPVDGDRHHAGADGPSLSDPPSPRLGTRRRAVLECVQRAPEAVGVADVAALTHLHPNTARFHLDALAADELVARTVEPRTTRGRPRILYAATAEATAQRSYTLLAHMLAHVASSSGDGHSTPVTVGRSWGRTIVEHASDRGALSMDDAVDTLKQVFDEVGFQPEVQTHGTEVALMLRHCPFREVATVYPDVVCGLHLGMLQGALAELGGVAVAESLDPLVTPHLCIARVRSAAAA
ncbi:helix-turn-helix domain-containing protein [Demequina sp.]|uniref:helix-turn-helix transcriptional regulator n=1 Tax=Demequina sp. TaxID=2050685 RepID=UPI0025B99877|nr:helix-turn-helix domain-containing protein [Demequina sp.]